MNWQSIFAPALLGLIASCANEPPGPLGLPVPLDARAAVGIKIAPVELTPKDTDLGVIGLGSYFVNGASGCVDCHGCPTYAAGQSPFKGGSGTLDVMHYLGGGAPMGPNLVAPGLTPDARGNPGGLTRAKFFDAMREGKDPGDATRRLQVMPWALYRHMTDEDLGAIYEYLRAIPPAKAGSCAAPGE
jgi:hypothetical protein